jgi:alkanesulfonate monooxygenase SsuD/methylene tetrahydromethanopterin reductase-like flavin-dependent oxidoreductase (luciferase family)
MGERPETGVRFSCVVIQSRPVDELRADWKLLEDAGLSGVWVIDHVKSFQRVGTLLEAWATLGFLAAATERIRIGTLVTNITYRQPAVLAKEALTIDHLSGGRLELGIGTGSTRRDDGLVAGVDEWSVAERADRFEEFVEATDSLLRGSPEYTAKYYRSEGFDRGPWSAQSPRPPLTIAAQGPRTLRVAARFADRWNALAGFGRRGRELLGFLKDCNAQLDELAEGFGREPRSVARSLLVQDSGFRWWDSPDAFSDFVGEVTATGVEEFVFYFPAYGDGEDELTRDTFLQLIAGVTHA